MKQTIRRQLNQLIRIVDDLLDASRFLRGQMQTIKESFDLRTVIEAGMNDHFVKPVDINELPMVLAKMGCY